MYKVKLFCIQSQGDLWAQKSMDSSSIQFYKFILQEWSFAAPYRHMVLKLGLLSLWLVFQSGAPQELEQAVTSHQLEE